MLPNIRVSYVSLFTVMHEKEVLVGEAVYVETFIYETSSPATHQKQMNDPQ